MKFRQWLKKQLKRNDWVGDLAQDVVADSGSKQLKDDYSDWHNHLTKNGASKEAYQALDQAWIEYQREK